MLSRVSRGGRAGAGHALVVDPWGAVVGRCDDPLAEDIAVVDVDAEKLATTRERMPVASHRRYDIYGGGGNNNNV